MYRLLILDLLDSMIQHKLMYQLGLWGPLGKHFSQTLNSKAQFIIDPMREDKFVLYCMKQYFFHNDLWYCQKDQRFNMFYVQVPSARICIKWKTD